MTTPTLKVTVLGCGGSTGVPQLGGADGRGDWGLCDPDEPRNRRTRASIVIEGGEGRLLVDTGPDLREQLLAQGVPAVDAVLYTHAHADHVCGIDDLRSINRLIDRPLDAWGFPETLDELAQRFSYAFRPWAPPGFYRPVLQRRPLDPGDAPNILGMTCAIFEQRHGRIRTLGFRIGGFAYSTDLVELTPLAETILAGVDTWLVAAFQRLPHASHAHLDQAIGWARRFGVRRTVLTHMGTDLDWASLAHELPHGVEPAFDGMIIESH